MLVNLESVRVITSYFISYHELGHTARIKTQQFPISNFHYQSESFIKLDQNTSYIPHLHFFTIPKFKNLPFQFPFAHHFSLCWLLGIHSILQHNSANWGNHKTLILSLIESIPPHPLRFSPRHTHMNKERLDFAVRVNVCAIFMNWYTLCFKGSLEKPLDSSKHPEFITSYFILFYFIFSSFQFWLLLLLSSCSVRFPPSID